MDKKLWTAEDIANKASWEGGLHELFDWGFSPEKVEPGPLQDAVKGAYDAFMVLDSALFELEKLLPEIEES